MGEIIELHHGQPAHPEDNQEFVADCCRYSENILSEEAVRKKWHFDNATWEKLGSNDALVEAIENEKVRRIRSGQQKRERAQVLVTQAPNILNSIMSDPAASPRHRVDAIKTLDSFASNGPESAPASDRFVITINLGSDVLKFDKSIAPDPNDVDPHHIDHTPQGLLAVIAANKRKDDGGGEPL
jgi:hypothetical protein